MRGEVQARLLDAALVDDLDLGRDRLVELVDDLVRQAERQRDLLALELSAVTYADPVERGVVSLEVPRPCAGRARQAGLLAVRVSSSSAVRTLSLISP